MKIWSGYGSEHSANLVIIGKFEAAGDAAKALRIIEEATQIARDDEAAGRIQAGHFPENYTKDMLDFLSKSSLMDFGLTDPQDLLYEFNARTEGEKVVITTEETEVSAFLKILLSRGAKIEIYSAHNHDGPYGR